MPDTVTANKTEAEAYSAVWDLMIELLKESPMAFVFMVRTHLWKIIKDMMKLEYFFQIPSFLKHLEKHVAKAEAIIYANK